MEYHPESVPINALVAVEGQIAAHNLSLWYFDLNLIHWPLPHTGTPLADGTALVVGGKDLLPKAVPPTALEMTRKIATTRVVLPGTMVRLSAGRMGFSQGEQTLMFLAGANSIFYGEQLLTTPNPEVDKDKQLFKALGLKGKVKIFSTDQWQQIAIIMSDPINNFTFSNT